MNRFILFLVIFFPSCLTLSKRYNNLTAENDRYKIVVDSQQMEYNKLQAGYDTMALRVVRMSQDSLKKRNEYRALRQRYDRVVAEGTSEIASNRRLLHENNLQFQQKQQMMDQIETFINTRDYILNDILARSEESMLQYISDGILVECQGGEVIIFTPDGMLFDSCEYRLSESAMPLINDISRLISSLRNVEVMIGGHALADTITREIPIDEWDISTARAVSITKEILSQEVINPKNIYPAGHGEWGFRSEPGNITAGRTEIIIKPIVEDIIDIIERATK